MPLGVLQEFEQTLRRFAADPRLPCLLTYFIIRSAADYVALP